MAKRRCKNKKCGIYFYPDTPEIYIRQEWCSDECKEAIAIQHYRKNQERAAKAREKAERKNKIHLKKKHAKERKVFDENDRPRQFTLTKRAAQRLANLLDRHLPCICCDEPRGKAQFCGGHFKTAGGHPELALDLRNIHGQRNQYCNKNRSGNIEGDKRSKGYKQGLVDRYGKAMLDYLESYHPPKTTLALI